MKTISKGQKVIHSPTGQHGSIVSCYTDGVWGVFRSTNGAAFHVHSSECVPEGTPRDLLDEILQGVLP